MANDALFAFVRAPFRQVEVDHLRYACAVAPGMVTLVPLLRPVHRQRRSLEIKVGKAFKRTRNERVRTDVDDAVDIRILEVSIQQQLEVGDITATVVVDVQRNEFALKIGRIDDGEAVVDIGMPLAKRVESGARGIAQVQGKVVDVVEDVLAGVLEQRRHRHAHHESEIVVALKQYVDSLLHLCLVDIIADSRNHRLRAAPGSSAKGTAADMFDRALHLHLH